MHNQQSQGIIPTVTRGHIERLSSFKSNFVSRRHIDVWLPNSYNSKNSYPVLYIHDGQMLFDAAITWNKQSWQVAETMDSLINEQRIQACIVVGIWNVSDERHSDYFPQKPFNMLPQTYLDEMQKKIEQNDPRALFAKSINSDNYLQFITKELKPRIDQTYATQANKESTFVAGSSMGGLISLYALCEYPDVFSGAACLSTHWVGTLTSKQNPIPDTFIRYLDKHLPPANRHQIYFDYGTETLDALYEPHQKRVDELMRSKGYTETNWQTLRFEGDDHSERSWRKRLHYPLTFLLTT